MASDLEKVLALVAGINPIAFERGLDTLVSNPEVDSIVGIGNAGIKKILVALWSALPSGSVASLPLLYRFLGQFGASKDKTQPPTRNAKLTFELISNPGVAELLRAKKTELGRVFSVVLRKENPELRTTDVEVLLENTASALDTLRTRPECAKILENLQKELGSIADQRKVLEGEKPKLWRNTELEIKIAMLQRDEEKLYRDKFKELMSILPQALLSSGLTGTSLARSLEFLGASLVAVLGGTSIGDSVITASLAAAEEDKQGLVEEISAAVKVAQKRRVVYTRGSDGEGRTSLREILRIALQEEKGSSERIFVVRSACTSRLAAGDFSGLPLSGDSMELQNRDINGLKFQGCRLEGISFTGSSLTKCNFTDATVTGSLDLSDAVVDTETLRSFIPTLREAKARGIVVKTEGMTLYHDGTPLDLSDTGLGTVNIIRPRTYGSYLWGESPSTIPVGETTTDHKDAVREARIARELTIAIATVKEWYSFPPLNGADAVDVWALVQSMPEHKRAIWDSVLTSHGVALIEHIAANTENGLRDVVTSFESTAAFQSATEAVKQAPKALKPAAKGGDLEAAVDATVDKSAKLLQSVVRMLAYKEDDTDTSFGIFLSKKLLQRVPHLNPALVRAIRKIKMVKIVAFIVTKGIGSARKALKLLATSKELGTNLQLTKRAVATYAERVRARGPQPFSQRRT